ncbi:2-hydroxyacid dehydrogenase [Jiella pacifica]|nr:2-hydroxyacid dehydrogenase [Jiella pacifica]
MALRIVFHGRNAASFVEGFDTLLDVGAELVILPDQLADDAQRAAFAEADVIVGNRFDADMPSPNKLRLYQVCATGYDGVELSALPASAAVCNCFGHEPAIAEYVMAGLLSHQVRLVDADRRLRQNDWAYRSGSPANVHGEIAGKVIGLLGFGHIGKAIAKKAKAFDMVVHAANRSPVEPGDLVDRSYGLDALPDFYASADFVVVSLPLSEETRSLVDDQAFGHMKPEAVLVNVGRGPVVDEAALFEALSLRRIGGAIIDTWYRYPGAEGEAASPSRFDFAGLSNVVMTPHMSGWTDGTIDRRRRTIAGNVDRLVAGEPLANVVRPAQ